MSTTYKTISGDTFDRVSRRKYGYEGESSRIIDANPGVSEPLIPGTILNIPSIFPKNLNSQTPSENINEVSIIIDGELFKYWGAVKITDSLDGITTVDFTAPFESDGPGFKEAFRPFNFTPVEVLIGGVRKFNGYMVAVNPRVSDTSRTLSLSCYSLPGNLTDCNPSPPLVSCTVKE